MRAVEKTRRRRGQKANWKQDETKSRFPPPAKNRTAHAKGSSYEVKVAMATNSYITSDSACRAAISGAARWRPKLRSVREQVAPYNRQTSDLFPQISERHF